MCWGGNGRATCSSYLFCSIIIFNKTLLIFDNNHYVNNFYVKFYLNLDQLFLTMVDILSKYDKIKIIKKQLSEERAHYSRYRLTI